MKNGTIFIVIVILLMLSAAHIPGQTSGKHQHDSHESKAQAKKSLGKAFPDGIPDVEVTDQDGKKMRFYSDLLKDKVVVVNFIFTNCNYICPRQGEHFSKLQREFGERLGKDIFMLSISIDPERDTPEALTEWAKKHGRKKGWSLITGETAKMDILLQALTGDKSGPEKHSPIVLLGNDTTTRWIRTYGFAEPEEIVNNLIVISQAPIDEGQPN